MITSPGALELFPYKALYSFTRYCILSLIFLIHDYWLHYSDLGTRVRHGYMSNSLTQLFGRTIHDFAPKMMCQMSYPCRSVEYLTRVLEV